MTVCRRMSLTKAASC